MVSRDTFEKVDDQIWQALWRWAKRRHPKKGKQWIASKYFHTVENRNWVFASETHAKNGEKFLLKIVHASKTKIIRHVKIKAGAIPYVLEWQQDFEEREGMKMLNGVKGRHALLTIRKAQKGICPYCNEPINTETPWVTHATCAKS